MQTEITNPAQERKRRGSTLWRAIATAALLGFVGVVVQQVAFSGASITWKTANPGNTEHAGPFSFDSDKDGQVIISVPGMQPGDVKTGAVTLTGAGDYNGAYTLARTALVDTPSSPAFSSALRLKIEETAAGREFYNGPLNGFTSASLGGVAVGDSRTFTFTLTFPTSASDPALQGASTTAPLVFMAVAQ